jgi:hypothetical protein
MSEPLNPNDLNELMNRDPIGLTDDEILKAVVSFRAMRHKFAITGDTRAGRLKQPKAKAGDSILTESLGIEL